MRPTFALDRYPLPHGKAMALVDIDDSPKQGKERQMFHLRLYHDELPPGGSASSRQPVPHTIFYVFAGAATIGDRELSAGQAAYLSEYAPIEAGADGATIWRWELVEKAASVAVLPGDGVASRLRMARDVKMFELVPTSRWLFRLDEIIGFQGTTGVHSHPGSGIRCMVSGHLRADSEKNENSDNRNPGDVWYEEGAYPLVSTVDPGVKTTFVRGMILPPEFYGFQDSAIWISGQPEGGPIVEGWEVLAQQVVTLK